VSKVHVPADGAVHPKVASAAVLPPHEPLHTPVPLVVPWVTPDPTALPRSVTGHAAVQAPPAHPCPLAHARPQVPQLAGSVWRLTQRIAAPVPQTDCGDVQTSAQVPARQAWPEGHTRSHAPQLDASLWRLRQRIDAPLPQTERGDEQASPQVPATHI